MAGAPEPSEVAQHSGTAVCSRRSMQWHLKVEDLNKLANLSQTDDEASHCDATRLIVPACRRKKPLRFHTRNAWAPFGPLGGSPPLLRRDFTRS